MAEVVSKRPERPRRHMKLTLKSGLCQGPREGGQGQEGEGGRAHRLAHPDGHLPSCWLAPGLSRVTFPKDFLRWREQSLNEERDPGTQQGINSPQEAHQPGPRRLCPAKMSQSIPCDPRVTEEWGCGLVFQGQCQRVEVSVLAPLQISG